MLQYEKQAQLEQTLYRSALPPARPYPPAPPCLRVECGLCRREWGQPMDFRPELFSATPSLDFTCPCGPLAPLLELVFVWARVVQLQL